MLRLATVFCASPLNFPLRAAIYPRAATKTTSITASETRPVRRMKDGCDWCLRYRVVSKYAAVRPDSFTHLPKPSSKGFAGFDWSIIEGYELIFEGKLSSIQEDSGCIGCMLMFCINSTETRLQSRVLSLEPTPWRLVTTSFRVQKLGSWQDGMRASWRCSNVAGAWCRSAATVLKSNVKHTITAGNDVVVVADAGVTQSGTEAWRTIS